MNRVKPSFWLFLGNTSFPVNPVLFFVLIILNIYSINYLSPPASPPLLFWLNVIYACAILALGYRFLSDWKKFRELSLVFRSGVETTGKILDVHLNWVDGYISYEYQYQEQNHYVKLKVLRNKKTKDVSVGQAMTLYVNPKNPSQTFIRDLYLNTFQPISNY